MTADDHNYVVSGGQDTSIIIWNHVKGTLVKKFTGIHNHEVLDVSV